MPWILIFLFQAGTTSRRWYQLRAYKKTIMVLIAELIESGLNIKNFYQYWSVLLPFEKICKSLLMCGTGTYTCTLPWYDG